MKTMLITGAAGYIGSELISYFIEEYKIIAYDIMMYDKTSLLRYAGHENFEFVKGDVRDLGSLKKYMSKADIIVPLAALVGFPLYIVFTIAHNVFVYDFVAYFSN